MAIRNSGEEKFLVNGEINEIKRMVSSALSRGGFSSIMENKLLNQFTADYKKMTIWGKIIITLYEENDKVAITAKSTANVDNIYALFSSPTQKILDKFKANL